MASRAFTAAFLVTYAFHQLVLAQECNRPIQAPVAIPVRNVTLNSGRVRRGLEFQIGTPPQPLAIGVASYQNSTYIYGQTFDCGLSTADACATLYGGLFDEGSSSTWNSFSTCSQLGNLDPGEQALEDTCIAGTDILTVNTSFSIADYPIGLPQNNNLTTSLLGMGVDSTLLATLYRQGSIASKSYSLFWGETGIETNNQMDGAVVLGGYDGAKATGENHTMNLDLGSACNTGMVVSVTNMELVFPNGTSASIFTGGEKGQSTNYCVQTDFPMITMNAATWDQWVVVDPSAESNLDTNSNRARQNPNVWGLLFPSDQVSQVDLRITIDGSFEVTVPNHQLVQYYYYFDDNGDLFVNDTVRELMINPLESINANDIPIFGLTFLQAAYLHVNYDEETFTLWQATPTAAQSLIGVGSSAQSCPSTSNTATSTIGLSSSSSANPSASSDGTKKASSSSISGGAIGGIVVGAVATLVIAAFAFWFFYFSKRRQSIRPSSPETSQTRLYHDDPGSFAMQSPQKSQIYERAELSASSTVPVSNRPNWMNNPASPATSGDAGTTSTWVASASPPPQELPSEQYR